MHHILTLLAALLTPALAAAQETTSAAPDAYTSLLPLLFIFVIFYFLLIRPQQKRHKQHLAMIAALKKGDQVITSGGIYGKVTKIEDDKVTVEIAPGVEVAAVKATLQQVVAKPEAGAGKPAHQEKSKSDKNDNTLPAKERVANDN
jgi:preprotein translocase subunit YajC